MVERKVAELFLNELVGFEKREADTTYYRTGTIILVDDTSLVLLHRDGVKETIDLCEIRNIKSKRIGNER